MVKKKKERKKEEELNPEIIPSGNKDFSPESFFSDENKTHNIIESELKLPDIIDFTKNEERGSDTFFKEIIAQLMSGKDISLKTEYMNENETFTGSKLEFLTTECGFGSGKAFLPIWEKKRVSQGRKSRQEIVMGLWERQKERQAQEEKERRATIGGLEI